MSDARNIRITAMLLGNGWAAAKLADFEDKDDFYTYTDVLETGDGRYPHASGAIREAYQWANDEGLPIDIAATPPVKNDVEEFQKMMHFMQKVYNTPEKAKNLLIQEGVLNADGSPSSNFYTEEEIAEWRNSQ